VVVVVVAGVAGVYVVVVICGAGSGVAAHPAKLKNATGSNREYRMEHFLLV
jgi:hypothetical protein